MFRNSENWGIVIEATDDVEKELRQLYDIYTNVHHVLMVDFYDSYSTLRWHISNLEEKLHIKNDKLNGSLAEYDPSALHATFEMAREAFNDDKRFRQRMIEMIYRKHREIDELAEWVPKMLKYYKYLLKRIRTPLVKRTISSSTALTSTWADVKDMFISTATGEPLYEHVPQLSLYHIDTRPVPPEEPLDIYLDYLSNYC